MGVFTFFFSLFVYLLTLTPTVSLHDSGDMTTASWILGICHPTGYPFYMLLGKSLGSLIPIGSIALRFNFLSSIFASLCTVFVYYLIKEITKKKIPSLIGGLIFAFTTRFWEQAIIAEKYTLNALFFALLSLLLIKRKWLLLSFFLGLSFSHHTQTIFFIPACIFFILAISLKTRKKAKKKTLPILKIVILFIIPLLLWLYLPIRASQDPELNWNIPKDLFGFKNHITGFGYTGLFSPPSFINIFEHLLKRVIPIFLGQFTLPFLILGAIGFILSLKRYPIFAIFSFIVVLFNIYMAISYNIPNIEDYYIVSFIYISIFIGIFSSFIPRNFIFLILPLILLILHFSFCNRRDYYLIYDRSLDLINNLSKNSISFYTMDYSIFPLWYLLYVEKRRNDISPILYPYFHQDWMLYKLLKEKPYLNIDKTPSRNRPLDFDSILKNRFETLVINNPKTPIYLDFKSSIPPSFIHIPAGLMYKIGTFSDIHKELDRPLNFRLRKLSKIKEGRLKGIILEYSRIYQERGELCNILKKHKDALSSYLSAIKINKNPSLYTELGRTYAVLERYNEAEMALKSAISLNSNYTEAYVNLGIVYFKMNKKGSAISSLKKALEIDPGNIDAKRNLLIIQGSL